MPKIYSMDLRKKVLDALKDGATAVSLSHTFKIARKTIYNWQVKLEKTGSLKPNPIGPKYLSGKIQDLGRVVS